MKVLSKAMDTLFPVRLRRRKDRRLYAHWLTYQDRLLAGASSEQLHEEALAIIYGPKKAQGETDD